MRRAMDSVLAAITSDFYRDRAPCKDTNDTSPFRDRINGPIEYTQPNEQMSPSARLGESTYVRRNYGSAGKYRGVRLRARRQSQMRMTFNPVKPQPRIYDSTLLSLPSWYP